MQYTAACVQLAPKKADVEHNLKRVCEAVDRCAGEGADIVIFPETCLSGYFLEGGVLDVAISAEDLAQRLFDGVKSRPIDVIAGFYEKSDDIYNSAIHVELGENKFKIRHVHRKFFLPTYGVFDEERFVARGRDISAYESRIGKCSVLICEDIWHSVSPMISALKGAQTIFSIAASPAREFQGERPANLETYRRVIVGMAEEHGVWAVNSMLCGFEGGKGFTGGSVIVDPFGKIVAEGPVGEEHVLMAEIDLDAIAVARHQSPLLADLTSTLEDVTREIDDINSETCARR